MCWHKYPKKWTNTSQGGYEVQVKICQKCGKKKARWVVITY